MPDDEGPRLSKESEQLYRKTKVPHKFCPYCGTRNEADADRCSNCGKDISWMKVPEPIPSQEPPYQHPRSMPEQKKIFTTRAIIVFALILLILLALILVLVFTTTSKSKAEGVSNRVAAPAGCPGSCPSTAACPCRQPGASSCGCR